MTVKVKHLACVQRTNSEATSLAYKSTHSRKKPQIKILDSEGIYEFDSYEIGINTFRQKRNVQG